MIIIIKNSNKPNVLAKRFKLIMDNKSTKEEINPINSIIIKRNIINITLTVIKILMMLTVCILLKVD